MTSTSPARGRSLTRGADHSGNTAQRKPLTIDQVHPTPQPGQTRAWAATLTPSGPAGRSPATADDPTQAAGSTTRRPA